MPSWPRTINMESSLAFMTSSCISLYFSSTSSKNGLTSYQLLLFMTVDVINNNKKKQVIFYGEFLLVKKEKEKGTERGKKGMWHWLVTACFLQCLDSYTECIRCCCSIWACICNCASEHGAGDT